MTRLAILALAVLMLAPGTADAQTLKIGSLRVFHSDVVGPWVSYRVRTRTGRTAVREFTQRVAIVAREKVGEENGYWVELKTTDRSGVRIERGLFAARHAFEGDAAGDPSAPGGGGSSGFAPTIDAAQPLQLVRYQMLVPGGKLYEYPVSSAYSLRAGGGVSTYELFEFDPSVKPVRSFLGPDTLRMGRRVVPAVLEWTSRAGTDDWPVMEDSASTYRLVLTQTLWRNAAVPITGFARSLFRVTTKKVPAAPDTARMVSIFPDTMLVFAPADTTKGITTMTPGDGHLLAWTELVLEDLGADAVAEVTQTPEPAPVSDHVVPGVIR